MFEYRLHTCFNIDCRLQVAHKKKLQQFLPFCKLILGSFWPASLSIIFSAYPEWVFFIWTTMISIWMYYFHIFFLDFQVALPERPDLGNTSTNPLPICSWCWCSLSMATSPSKPAGIRFPRIHHLLLYTTTNITPCCCFITPFCCLITPFYWYIIENLRCTVEIAWLKNRSDCYMTPVYSTQKAIYHGI